MVGGVCSLTVLVRAGVRPRDHALRAAADLLLDRQQVYELTEDLVPAAVEASLSLCLIIVLYKPLPIKTSTSQRNQGNESTTTPTPSVTKEFWRTTTGSAKL